MALLPCIQRQAETQCQSTSISSSKHLTLCLLQELAILGRAGAAVVPKQPWWPAPSASRDTGAVAHCTALLWVHALALSLGERLEPLDQ